MSYGIPVVSTDVSGAQDALAADNDGFAAGVVTDFDPASIAEAIALLQEDPGTRGSMSRFARRRAITRFSTDQMLTAWEEFLADPSKQA
jgi:glycosyltransferase involved in cell wall biosynthesis